MNAKRRTMRYRSLKNLIKNLIKLQQKMDLPDLEPGTDFLNIHYEPWTIRLDVSGRIGEGSRVTQNNQINYH